MILEKVISGGQTGVDQVALEVAQSLGFKTGGTAPAGWRTDAGPAPWLGERFGLRQCVAKEYKIRTVLNCRVDEHQNPVDATFWFGNIGSPGGQLTRKIALIEMVRRRYVWLFFTDGSGRPAREIAGIVQSVLDTQPIKILNVAGNRLRTNPAAADLAREVLTIALRPAEINV